MAHFSYDIQEILDRLPPLTQLFERDGHSPRKSGSAWFAPCPFHDEKSPSCQINDERGKFHCFGCGAGGDSFDYWQKSRGVSFQDALADLAAIAGVGPRRDISAPRNVTPRPRPPEPEILPITGADLDKWHAATSALLASPTEIQRIAEWRGIHPEAVEFVASRGLMGIYSYYSQPREAFLVEKPSPTGLIPVSVHIRLAPGTKGNETSDKASWRYNPSNCGSWPWVVGDLSTAEHLFLLEGQWDALALISVMGWHEKFPKRIAVAGLRGSTSTRKLLEHTINPDAYIFAIADADGAGAGWFKTGGLLDSLHQILKKPSRLHAFWPSTPGSDLNDLVKSGELTRDGMLCLILPKLPNSHTRISGPTFTQWCRLHQADDSPDGAAAAFVLADPRRLKGRRPLAAWHSHWRRTGVPPDKLDQLLAAWSSYRASCQ